MHTNSAQHQTYQPAYGSGAQALAALYDTDAFAWANTTTRLLRERRFDEIDFSNLIEEIEDMGKREKRELESRLEILLGHLLKWQFQPQLQSNSWLLTIREQRLRLQEHLAQNPSLRAKVLEAIALSYKYALLLAIRETGLTESTFPTACPYSVAEILQDGWTPL
jgi:Domain of unknown function DUF29